MGDDGVDNDGADHVAVVVVDTSLRKTNSFMRRVYGDVQLHALPRIMMTMLKLPLPMLHDDDDTCEHSCGPIFMLPTATVMTLAESMAMASISIALFILLL